MYVLVSKLDFVVSGRTVGRRMTCGLLNLLCIWYRQGYGCSASCWAVTLAVCSSDRPGHAKVDPCWRVDSSRAFELQLEPMRSEVKYAALRSNRDVATFPSALSYGRVQFMEKVLLYLRYVSFYFVL